ncbi:MAG: VCBS repeat-containing protein [Gomphosphaeria aponina SAG 52.96 = DSM 107014]|uniref:VCBS repeat-containing protein n=1 Tax=Gomphosphaeria aponina SAG 52.96 = DSM 107014 TaxID=1521640 RepID=A0A941GTJ7_9CHRO|nr:VCBS repeat-containing protein [Gomphosphaeria aponina SAG 52.96 = DSM 107014]
MADNTAPRFIKTPIFIVLPGTSNPLNGFDVGYLSTPTLADIDGDGDLDAFIGEKDGTFKYYQNTGSKYLPKFVEVTGTSNPLNGFDVGGNSKPTLADIDGDGDLDAFSGEGKGTFKYYQNTGTKYLPKFVEVTGTNNPLNGFVVVDNSAPVLADIDEDGDLDAFSGERLGTFKFYQNTGTKYLPKFVEVTGGNNPLNGFDVGYNNTPVLVDIDGDGDFDAFSGENNGTFKYYQNTGTKTSPKFVEITGAANPLNGFNVGVGSAPALVDIERDGDIDVLSGEFDGIINFYKDASPEPTYNLAEIKKNETAPFGSAIEEIITDGTVTKVEAVAIIGADNSNGNWQYSTDQGNTWQDFGAVTETNARLLDSTNRVRFIPNGNSTGTANITLRLWDKSTGVVGETADASNNGGNTAFSAGSTTATVNVVNQVIQTFVVTQSTDNGKGDVTGSLSWAIKQANQTVEADIVELQTNVRLDIKDDDPNTLDPARSQVIVNSNLTIKGNDHTISGDDNNNGVADKDGSDSPILFIKQGTVSIENVTLENGVAKGGDSNNGGGGAGMGGALFIYQGNVKLTNVNFKNNHAVGGSRGISGLGHSGGGMGGNSSSTGGGGLFGSTGATDPAAYITPGSKGDDGGNNPGSGGNPIGSFGGRGGKGAGGGYNNGGAGGAGGFGGGGGIGGDKGFLGGYGGNGGTGGFGGGGGTGGFGNLWGKDARGGFGGGSGGAAAGFGGGAASGSAGFGGGKGGAGMGGAIFIRTGTVNLNNVTFENNSATGGTGSNNGQGLGHAIFIINSAAKTAQENQGNTQGMPSDLAIVNGNGVYILGNSQNSSGAGAYGVENINDTTANMSPSFTAPASLQDVPEDKDELSIIDYYTPYSINGLLHQKVADNNLKATLKGIAIVGNTANPTTEGKWKYSTDDKKTWYDIGAVGDNNTALALSANTFIIFVPVANYDQNPPALQIRAIDETYTGNFTNGATRQTIDTSVNGNGQPISGDVGTLGINIIAVPEDPTDITLEGNTIEENKPKGTVVGVLDNNDPDTGDIQTYRLVYKNPVFQINGDNLETKLPLVYDENGDNSFELLIEVKDQAGGTYQEWFTVNVLPIFQNSAPTDIILSNNSIEENQPVGTEIGNLQTVDPNTGQTHTYQILTPDVPFVIENGVLKTTALLDYETQTSYDLEIETNDGNGGTYKETFTVQVNNISDSATIKLTPTELKVVEGLNNAVFDVTVKGASAPVSVQYLTEDGTAIAATDYTQTEGQLTFETNGTKQITIPIVNDNLNEEDKTFKVIVENQEVTVTVTDTQETAATSTLPGKVENLLLTGEGNINGTGNTGNNILTGNNGNNTLSGLGGNDQLIGNSGNDNLNGGTGADSLTGGEGNDNYYVDNVADKVTENPNEGTADRVISSVEYTLTEDSNVENMTLNGSAPIDGTGNSQNNNLVGNSKNNTLTGLAGNDILDGKAGADKLLGGTENDTYYVDNVLDEVTEITGQGTADKVISSVKDYTLPDNVENLNIIGDKDGNGTGNSLNNIITGDSSDNILKGEGGNDNLNGGAGVDEMTGGPGNDIYTVDDLADVIKEISGTGQGTDLVFSPLEDYTLPNNVEKLTLQGNINGKGTGNTLANTITGDNSDNILTGGTGNDLLIGKNGNDTLIGGQGADRFDFYLPTEGVDSITDFTTKSDKIYIKATGFGGELTVGTLTSEQFVTGSAALDDNDRFLYHNGALFYDVDGTGAGIQVQLANITGSVVASDIIIF